MHIRSQIPAVEPTLLQPPEVCPYEGCEGTFFKDHQLHCGKRVRDTQVEQVVVMRRKCLACGRTHRVYPRGVSKSPQSDRFKAVSVLLYVLGLSYRGVEDFLTALGFYLDHTSVFRNVQAAGEQTQHIRGTWLHQIAGKVSVVAGDLTYLSCRGEKVAIAVAIDAQAGVVLEIEIVDNEETETLQSWLDPLLKLVGAQALITDDQDAFKTIADEASVSHQICRQHVTRNVLDFIARTVERVLATPPPVPAGLDLTVEQLLDDLAMLEWIMLGQPETAPQILAELYDRYARAPAPQKGKRATVWYRMRNHILRLWNHWQRYTCYRTAPELPIEETNNAVERTIGWSIKERSRTMRGYKSRDSILNVASLTAWLHEAPNGREMSPLFAS